MPLNRPPFETAGLIFAQFCFYFWNLLVQRLLDVAVSKVSTNFGRNFLQIKSRMTSKPGKGKTWTFSTAPLSLLPPRI